MLYSNFIFNYLTWPNFNIYLFIFPGSIQIMSGGEKLICPRCDGTLLRYDSRHSHILPNIWCTSLSHRLFCTGAKRTPEYRLGTLMPVRTILTQKLASTLMQSGQSRPILRGYPDDYPDKNAAPRSLMVPPCHVFVAGRLRVKVGGFKCTVRNTFLDF